MIFSVFILSKRVLLSFLFSVACVYSMAAMSSEGFDTCKATFNQTGNDNYIIGFIPETGDYFSAAVTSGKYIDNGSASYLKFSSGEMHYYNVSQKTGAEFVLDASQSQCMDQLGYGDDLHLFWVNRFNNQIKKTIYGIALAGPLIKHGFFGYVETDGQQQLALLLATPKQASSLEDAVLLFSRAVALLDDQSVEAVCSNQQAVLCDELLTYIQRAHK